MRLELKKYMWTFLIEQNNNQILLVGVGNETFIANLYLIIKMV
jgi:hypothetical protein